LGLVEAQELLGLEVMAPIQFLALLHLLVVVVAADIQPRQLPTPKAKMVALVVAVDFMVQTITFLRVEQETHHLQAPPKATMVVLVFLLQIISAVVEVVVHLLLGKITIPTVRHMVEMVAMEPHLPFLARL
jgi:hypothetical protein